MSGCMIGFPNRIDDSTLSGGSWVSTLPLTNIKNRVIGKVARSTDATLASTKFDIDLQASQIVEVVSLVNHNISLSGKYKIRATDESAATNILKYSEQLDNAVWSKYKSSIIANAILSPDGTISGDRLVEDNTNGGHYVEQLPSLIAANIYTRSIFVKGGEKTKIRLEYYSKPTVAIGAFVTFNTINGTFNSPSVIGGAIQNYSAVAYPNGWWRVSQVVTLGSADVSCYCRVALLGVNESTTVYTGDGVSGLYLWGAQLETGPTMTSYYPTTSVAATRPAGYMDSWQSYAYDTGWTAVWPAVYSSDSLDWEATNWWYGVYSKEEISGYTTNLVSLFSKSIYARYFRVEIDDTSNDSAYVQVGRLFIGPIWQPENNASVGLSIGIETSTVVQRALSGAKYFQRRVPSRVTRFSLDIMSVDEALSNAFEIDRRAGIDSEVLWIQEEDDTIHALRRRWLGTLRTLSPIEFPYANIGKKAYEIEELI